MDYQANEIKILKSKEFLLLLAASGIETWHGIDLSEERAGLEEDRTFNANMASLYQKDALDWQEGKACIKDEYRQIFAAIRDANLCVLVRTGGRPELVRSCYLGDGPVVAINHTTASGDEVEISMNSKAEWIDSVMAELEMPIDAEEAPEEDADQVDVLSELELRAVPDGKQLETLRLCESGLAAFIQTEAGGRTKREAFNEARVREVLNLWCGGNT